jgi:hypothetical protein
MNTATTASSETIRPVVSRVSGLLQSIVRIVRVELSRRRQSYGRVCPPVCRAINMELTEAFQTAVFNVCIAWCVLRVGCCFAIVSGREA